jgi:hypothetical protein
MSSTLQKREFSGQDQSIQWQAVQTLLTAAPHNAVRLLVIWLKQNVWKAAERFHADVSF